jgi:uncharacterized lipoprotein YddW (UPF0748 family)
MPHIERPTVVFQTWYGSLSRALAGLLFLSLLGQSAWAQELTGVWISPDWFFPGDRRYSEAEVRETARWVMDDLKEKNVDTVFLETFLRGYGICPSIQRDDRAKTAELIPYSPGTQGHPVYPHLQWDYNIEFGTVLDPLQIFIEEGQANGIEVHAWVHMFYWRMDNNDIMLNWHNGPTLWGHLMEQYLREQAERLALIQDSSVRPGYEQVAAKSLGDDIPVDLLLAAADLFSVGCNTVQLEEMLADYDLEANGHPMGTLIRHIIRSGGQRPDFVLMASDAEPFPAPRGKHLRSIYVDPEHPAVRKELTEAVLNIARTHPGLGGIHLDHIRYPVDGQGLDPATGVIDGKYRYFSASEPAEMRQYQLLTHTLERRQVALSDLVHDIAEEMPRRMALSAAVLPLYYRDRDNGKFRTSGYDYAAQAWLDWPVDFVVPMMYEYHPYLIRTLVEEYQTLANSANPEDPIGVYPGISRLRYTRNGSVKPRGWVFFDLTLARDVKNPRQEAEDLDFGGE